MTDRDKMDEAIKALPLWHGPLTQLDAKAVELSRFDARFARETRDLYAGHCIQHLRASRTLMAEMPATLGLSEAECAQLVEPVFDAALEAATKVRWLDFMRAARGRL